MVRPTSRERRVEASIVISRGDVAFRGLRDFTRTRCLNAGRREFCATFDKRAGVLCNVKR